MTTATKAGHVVERMSELRIVKFSYRCNMMNIRLVADLFTGYSTVLACMIVSFERFTSHRSPLPVVGIVGASPLFRQPNPKTVLTAKPYRLPFCFRFENSSNPSAALTDTFYALDIVDFVVWCSKKFIGFFDTVRTVYPGFVGRIVFERGIAPFTRSRFGSTFPVSVIFPAVWITLIVELSS